MKEFLAKGKRGLTYLTELDGKTVVVKEKNPETDAEGFLKNEYKFLKKLNKHGLGPELYDYEDNKIYMEYIDGEFILDFLKSHSKPECLYACQKILEKGKKLDDLGVNKYELTHPQKHIIVRDYDPVFIDFEKCRHREEPQNVTQLCQFLTSREVIDILKEVKFRVPKGEVRELAQRYKQDYEEEYFEEILDLFDCFENKVYRTIENIPRGCVSTYKDVAEAIDSSAIAVGQALKKNPWAPDVPCHRVVASDGSLGGYCGSTSGEPLEEKTSLLEKEGVTVEEGIVKDFDNKRYKFE